MTTLEAERAHKLIERARIERQIENCLVAKAMMDSLPDSAILPRLDDWANWEMRDEGPHACGAAACFGGWVAVHPYFKALGVIRWRDGSPMLQGRCLSVGETLFGVGGMFCGNYSHGLSDREEIDRRLRYALDNLANELGALK